MKQFNCRVAQIDGFHLRGTIFASFSISSIQRNTVFVVVVARSMNPFTWIFVADARKFVFTWMNECSFKLTADIPLPLLPGFLLQIFHLLNFTSSFSPPSPSPSPLPACLFLVWCYFLFYCYNSNTPMESSLNWANEKQKNGSSASLLARHQHTVMKPCCSARRRRQKPGKK